MKCFVVLIASLVCLAHARSSYGGGPTEHYEYSHHGSQYDRPASAHHHYNQQPQHQTYTTHRVPLHSYETTTPTPSKPYPSHHYPSYPVQQQHQSYNPYGHNNQYYDNAEDFKTLFHKKPLYVQPYYYVKHTTTTTTPKPKPVHKPHHYQKPSAHYPSHYPSTYPTSYPSAYPSTYPSSHYPAASNYPHHYNTNAGVNYPHHTSHPSNDYNYHYGTQVNNKPPTTSHEAYKPSAPTHKPSSHYATPAKPTAAPSHYDDHHELSHNSKPYEHHQPAAASHNQYEEHQPSQYNYDKYPKEEDEETLLENKQVEVTTAKVQLAKEDTVLPKENVDTVEEPMTEKTTQ